MILLWVFFSFLFFFFFFFQEGYGFSCEAYRQLSIYVEEQEPMTLEVMTRSDGEVNSRLTALIF
jgi:hypothetical protein